MRTTLDSMRPGQRGRVTAIWGNAATKRRLIDMGVTKGALLEVCGASPFGDPIWVRIRGVYISMRKESAALVHVEPAADR